MKYDIDEIITGAIMTETPAVVVEGRDDIKFYLQIAVDAKKEVSVYAVENLEEFETGGCTSVITCIESLQDKIMERPENINYILGIIDRDARHFRKEIPSLLGLFVLKYYSYESHLVTRNNLKRLISDLTFVSQSLIDDTSLDFVESNLESDYHDLYYISLEALKNACVQGYNAIIGYDEKAGKVAVPNSKIKYFIDIQNKQDELNLFADKYNITPLDLKLIAKGKWLLYTFCYSIFARIKELTSACSDATINSCQFCSCGRPEKCLYTLRTGYSFKQVVSLMQNYFDYKEIGYIQTKISSLG